MSEYSNDGIMLMGEEILYCEIDGHGIELITSNGYRLTYYASDGGYSTWHIDLEEE